MALVPSNIPNVVPGIGRVPQLALLDIVLLLPGDLPGRHTEVAERRIVVGTIRRVRRGMAETDDRPRENPGDTPRGFVQNSPVQGGQARKQAQGTLKGIAMPKGTRPAVAVGLLLMSTAAMLAMHIAMFRP
jgi:hypothetical protein